LLSRTYGYDNAGNTLSYGTATFTYNNRGRMKTASNAGTTATYTYNALGQRIRRATSGLTTLYVYDEAGHLTGEYTAAGALVQETVWLGDIPVATVRPNGAGGVDLYYVHTDHLNTPRLVTDTANNIRWRWDSDAFGTTVPNENPSSLGTFEYNLRFPGQQYDAVVGLHYNYFRDYDSATARYSQADPIGLTGGVNAYHYVFNNPLRRLDPFGLQVTEDAPPGPAGTPTEPIYPSGAGKKAEEACDHEAGRAEAEKRAEDARARGDSNEYCRQKRRAYDVEIRYYAAMGIKIPKEPPPCMPFPPPPPKAPPSAKPDDPPAPNLPPPPELPK
jgi:RHS repeat-associated protein